MYRCRLRAEDLRPSDDRLLRITGRQATHWMPAEESRGRAYPSFGVRSRQVIREIHSSFIRPFSRFPDVRRSLIGCRPPTLLSISG